ncbi:MAG: IreB family regulatory phosphoprotein [Saccharofermentanales bacterium]
MLENNTSRFEIEADHSKETREIMSTVLSALREKGYNPINQLVGYFLSGDPTYITNHNGARGVIRRMERDELLEVIIREYVAKL